MNLFNKLFYGIFLSVLFFSCAKEEDKYGNIPNSPVNIEINYKTNTSFDNPYYYKKYYLGESGVVAAGYVGVFVISLYNSSGDLSVSAFELCCPYEAPVKNELEVVTDNWTMKCPKCGSVFGLTNGGAVITSPSTFNLRRYSVIKNDVFYRILN